MKLWNATESALSVDRVIVKTDSYGINGSRTLDLTATDYDLATVADAPDPEREVEVTFATPLTIDAGDQSQSVQVPILPIGDDEMTINVYCHHGTNRYAYSYTQSSQALGRNDMLTAYVKLDLEGHMRINLIDLSDIDGDFVAQDGDTLYGTLPASNSLEIAEGATVTLRNMQHEATSSSHDGITCLGDATIVLEGDNTVKGSGDGSGVYVPAGKTLIIKGNGSLNASAGDVESSAGIGSNYENDGGNIVIESGIITAEGSSFAAGIGAAQNHPCGDITIMGGTVTASGANAACIGGAPGAECGDITITGGVVTAEYPGYHTYVGIGGCSSCGDITISGGQVTAHSSVGIGINGGTPDDDCGDITISGGTVEATGTDGCGIGAQNGRCGEITISGGSVTASGSETSAGIGTGGNDATCYAITITNGAAYVEATKGEVGEISDRKCIGAGSGCAPVSVTIDRETDFIEATTYIGCFSAVLSNSNRTWTLINTNTNKK